MEIQVVISDIGDRSRVLHKGAAGVLVKAGISTALARGIVDSLKNDEKEKLYLKSVKSNQNTPVGSSGN